MRLKYGYDRASNRLWREDLVAQSYSKDFDEIYAYDGLHRLRDMQRGRLNGTQTALTTQTFGQCWNLDATGNWTGFKETDNGSTWTLEQSRTANTVNEIRAITNTTGAPWSQPRYGKAGNMTTLPGPALTGLDWTTLSTNEWSALTIDEWADLPTSHTKDATYDAWNRLIKLTDGPTGQTIQENQYDARTFRTIRKDYEAGTLSKTRHSYYSPDWRCVEERVDASPDADRQFVWGLRYIDELICRDRDTDSNGDLDERLYACQDANWNVVAAGDERFVYRAYGVAEMFSSDFSSREIGSSLWETRFAGYRWDSQALLYSVRWRVLSPNLQWLQRAPLIYWDSSNLYHYTAGNPIAAVDPAGLLVIRGNPSPLGDYLPPVFGTTMSMPVPNPAGVIYAIGAIAVGAVLYGTTTTLRPQPELSKKGRGGSKDTPAKEGPKPGPESNPRQKPGEGGPIKGDPPAAPRKCGCDQGEFKKMQKCGSKPHGHDWQWGFNQRTAQSMVETLVIGIDSNRVGRTKGERVQKSWVDSTENHINGMHFNYYDNGGALGATIVCCPCCYEDAEGNAKKGSQCYAPLTHKEKGEWELIQVVK